MSLSKHWIDDMRKKDKTYETYFYFPPVEVGDLLVASLIRFIPEELAREVRDYAIPSEGWLFSLVWPDIRSYRWFVGHLFIGFTSYRKSWYVSFKPPNEYQRTIGGYDIDWESVTVHREGDVVFLLLYNGKTCSVRFERNDRFGLYALLQMYRKVKKLGHNVDRRAYPKGIHRTFHAYGEINEVRQTLAEMLFGVWQLKTS